MTLPPPLKVFYADLHVHIGSSPWGGPVKISAAPGLTVTTALEESSRRKGIHIVGLVDAQTTGGLAEIERLCREGRLTPLAGGGLAYTGPGQDPQGQVDEQVGAAHAPATLIPGAEIETVEKVPGGGGPAHFLLFVPGLTQLRELNRWYGEHVTNPQLSSQRAHASAADLQQLAESLDGLFIPAHVFTPFKSLYGRCAPSWRAVLPQPPTAMELGLSADRAMATAIPELVGMPLISSSDAHSPARIAREYTAFLLAEPTFTEIALALAGLEGRGVAANYGLDPRLGKYYRSHCRRCNLTATAPPPVTACPRCGGTGRDFVPGVLDRITLLAAQAGDGRGHRRPPAPAQETPQDPPYIHQVPLAFVPGLGPRGREKLLHVFGTEMKVLHEATGDQLAEVVGPELARRIVAARGGLLPVAAGGGGRYGRVGKDMPPQPLA